LVYGNIHPIKHNKQLDGLGQEAAVTRLSIMTGTDTVKGHGGTVALGRWRTHTAKREVNEKERPRA